MAKHAKELTNENQSMWTYALVSMLVTICTSGFARMSYGIVMPFMKSSLSLTYQQAGMLGTYTAIGYLVMVLFVGIMAAKYGSKQLITIGLLLLSITLILLFFVQSYFVSIILMVCLGVGTAFGYTPLVNVVVGWFPKNRGLMVGFLLSGMGLGTLITSLLLPVINASFAEDGWRYLWLLFGLFTIIVTLIAGKFLQNPPIPLRNKKVKDDSLLHDVYLHKGVLLIAVIYGLIGFAYLIPQSFLFSFMLDVNISEYAAGIIMSLGGFISIFSGPLWGAISDKIGRKKSLIIVLFLGSFAVLIPITSQSVVAFTMSQFFWGLTIMGMLSLTQALSTEQTDQTYAPIALGYVTIFFASGQILGPGIGGVLIDYFGGVVAALWLCFGLFVLAFLLATRLGSSN